jgi:phosphoglycolate phosphatase-like HAD superfamily hydrolase
MKIVLSDLDKTLVDVNDQLVHALCMALDFLGKSYERSLLQRTSNLYRYLSSLGINVAEKDFWDFFDNYDKRDEGIRQGRIRLFPYSIDFLESMHDKKIAIVSDTPWKKAECSVRNFGLDRYVSVFSNWDISRHKRGKPDCELAVEALVKLDYRSDDLLYFVGDDAVDMECAENLEKHLRKKVVKIHVRRSGGCLLGVDFTVPDLLYASEIIEGD